MTRRRFQALLSGLSGEAVFRQAAGDALSTVDDPEQVKNALRG